MQASTRLENKYQETRASGKGHFRVKAIIHVGRFRCVFWENVWLKGLIVKQTGSQRGLRR